MDGCKRKLKVNELGAWCEDLVREFGSKTLLLLFGDLGVGKTFFVQTVIDVMGGEKAFSPTYSLINHYRTKNFKNIYHVDLYRLDDDEEIESVGFWDLFDDQKALVFVEWADRLKFSELPLDWKKIKVFIQYGEDEQSRGYSVLYC